MCVQLLMEAIEDEKRMFGDAPLTRKEREENAVRERILAIASEIKRSHEAQAEETYHLPQTYDKDAKGLSDRQKLLKARYKCAPAAIRSVPNPKSSCDCVAQHQSRLQRIAANARDPNACTLVPAADRTGPLSPGPAIWSVCVEMLHVPVLLCRGADHSV